MEVQQINPTFLKDPMMSKSSTPKEMNHPKVDDSSNPGNMYQGKNAKPKFLEKKGLHKKTKHVRN